LEEEIDRRASIEPIDPTGGAFEQRFALCGAIAGRQPFEGFHEQPLFAEM